LLFDDLPEAEAQNALISPFTQILRNDTEDDQLTPPSQQLRMKATRVAGWITVRWQLKGKQLSSSSVLLLGRPQQFLVNQTRTTKKSQKWGHRLWRAFYLQIGMSVAGGRRTARRWQ